MLAPKGQKRQKNQAPEKPKTTNTVEEILPHGDSINFTAARVSDTPSRSLPPATNQMASEQYDE